MQLDWLTTTCYHRCPHGSNLVYIYHTFSCALGSYGPSRPAGLTWMPSWAPSWTCAAKLSCRAALGRQVGLPRCTWTHLGAILSCNLASKCLSRALRTSNFASQYGTFRTFSKIALKYESPQRPQRGSNPRGFDKKGPRGRVDSIFTLCQNGNGASCQKRYLNTTENAP